MDMAAIESLTHEELIQSLINDVRSADDEQFTSVSSESSIPSITSSSKCSGVRFFTSYE